MSAMSNFAYHVDELEAVTERYHELEENFASPEEQAVAAARVVRAVDSFLEDCVSKM